MEVTPSEIQYQSSFESIDKLREAMQVCWDEILKNPEEKLRLEKKLGQGTELPKKAEKLIELKQEGAGLDPLTTLIIVNLAIPVAYDIWSEILLPKLRRRFGEDVLEQ